MAIRETDGGIFEMKTIFKVMVCIPILITLSIVLNIFQVNEFIAGMISAAVALHLAIWTAGLTIKTTGSEK